MSFLFSTLNYGVPLMYYTSASIKQRMHKLHMISYKFARGNYRFKESCAAIGKGVEKKVSEEGFFTHPQNSTRESFNINNPNTEKLELARMCSTAKIGLKVYTKN